MYDSVHQSDLAYLCRAHLWVVEERWDAHLQAGSLFGWAEHEQLQSPLQIEHEVLASPFSTCPAPVDIVISWDDTWPCVERSLWIIQLTLSRDLSLVLCCSLELRWELSKVSRSLSNCCSFRWRLVIWERRFSITPSLDTCSASSFPSAAISSRGAMHH